jgi:hypothetical protein
MAIHVRPVHAALYARLHGNAGLLALATGGVHRSVAPADTNYPYVVFSLQDAPERATFDGAGGLPGVGGHVRFVYVVKAVDRSLSDEAASAAYVAAHDLLIGDAAEAALSASLAADGLTCIGVTRETVLAFDEDDSESKVQHVGGVYNVFVQEA